MDREVFNQKVIPYFTLSLLLAFFGAAMGLKFLNFIIILFIPLFFVILILLAVIILAQRENVKLFYLFIFLDGLTLAPLIEIANITDPFIILEVLGLTTALFLAFSFYGWTTKKDFTSWGGVLFGLLILGLIFTIAQWFIRSIAFNLAVDFGVILLFLAYIIYDMSTILRKRSNDEYLLAVIDLYLDFTNIFVRIIHILIMLKKEE